jgi:hypothetical protein
MSINSNFLKLPTNIKNLDLTEIYDNLFFYPYHSKYLQKLQQNKTDKEDQHYISTYSSFIGEVFENIIYELLIRYAIKNDDITKFILKGPHQDNYENLKNGLMIDRNSQIVYKASYKDVTEFDALFFTKDSICFVESTIVKTTTSLRKRLRKKKALLETLFPKLKVKALIILSQGAIGVNVFPPYCTVWVTDALDDPQLIDDIIYKKDIHKKQFSNVKNKKLVHAQHIKPSVYKYFDTLFWILKTTRGHSKHILDIKFLQTPDLARYFEIYSKLYIGHITSDVFIKLLHYLSITSITEDIPLDNILDDQIVVTIEKTKNSFNLVYYLKIKQGRLKKLEIQNDILVVSNKDPKGFTAAEMKYMKYLFKKSYNFSFNDLKNIINYISL